MSPESTGTYVNPRWNQRFFRDPDSSDSSSSDSEFAQDIVIELSNSNISLCNRCAQMFSTLENLRCLTSREGYEHHDSAGLKEAAKLGCSFCKEVLLKKRKSYYEDENLLQRLRFFARREGTKDENMLQIPLIEDAFPDIDGYEAAEYPFDKWKLAGIGCGLEEMGFNVTLKCVVVENENPAAKFVERRPTVTNVGSPEVLAQAKNWLKECLDDHANCPQRKEPRLPTRVINVGRLGESTSARLHVSKLYETADYIALSYCWGGPQAFTTNKANLESNIQDMPAEKFPKTIRNAIFVTRSLGIQFLWIDAFCIIQDSDEDKAKEINNMGAIYKNATATISAASAMGANYGFLGSRASRAPRTYGFPFILPNGNLTTISITNFDLGTEKMEPLDKRAWCFQESMLSPRRLTFGTQELLWSCQSLDSRPISKSNTSYFSDLPRIPRRVFDPRCPDDLDEREKAQIWNSIVDGFTLRDITMPEDRLPAISGVLNELALAWNDVHIYGILEKAALRHLGWMTTRRGWGEHTEIPLNNRAPSWSWVSTDGLIIFHELTNIEVGLVGIDKAPALEEHGLPRDKGKILLNAKVLPMVDFPDDFFQKNRSSIILDAGRQAFDSFSEAALRKDGVLALLGTSEVSGEISLVLEQRSDGLLKRLGIFISAETDTKYTKPSGISTALNAAPPKLIGIV